MNISIFASVWCQNLWDELIVKNEVQLLEQEFWDKILPVASDIPLYEGELNESPSSRGIAAKQQGELYFRIFTYDTQDIFFSQKNIEYREYFPIAFRKPQNILRNIKNLWSFFESIIWSDIIVIWWGGIIYDSELQSVKNPLDQWMFRTKIARFFRKKIYFYAIWIDIKQEENFKKLSKILKKSWKITVRDEKSQKQLENIWIQSEIIDDPVMNDNTPPVTSDIPLDEGEQKQEKWTILWVHDSKKLNLKDFKNYDFEGKKIWLALRSWYIGSSGDSRIEKLLIEELCQYIEKQWWKVVFLPHSFHHSDELANDCEFMKQFLNYEREIYVSLWEVYTAYTHKILDIVISMRLHSIILSYVYGIDQIALSYSQKTDEVIKKIID